MPLKVKVDLDVQKHIEKVTGGDAVRKAAILADLLDLRVEPEPSRDGWRVTSTPVQFLCKAGFDVRRLTLTTNLPGHRFFYLHDPEHETVFVMEAVKRGPKTYDKMEESHIQQVIRKHTEYFGRKLWLK